MIIVGPTRKLLLEMFEKFLFFVQTIPENKFEIFYKETVPAVLIKIKSKNRTHGSPTVKKLRT